MNDYADQIADLNDRIDRARNDVQANNGGGAQRLIRIDARKTILRLQRELKGLGA